MSLSNNQEGKAFSKYNKDYKRDQTIQKQKVQEEFKTNTAYARKDVNNNITVSPQKIVRRQNLNHYHNPRSIHKNHQENLIQTETQITHYNQQQTLEIQQNRIDRKSKTFNYKSHNQQSTYHQPTQLDLFIRLNKLYQKRTRLAFRNILYKSQAIFSGSQGQFDYEFYKADNIDIYQLSLEEQKFQYAIATLQGVFKRANYMNLQWALNKLDGVKKKQQATQKIFKNIQSFQKRQEKAIYRQVIDIFYGIMLSVREQQQRKLRLKNIQENKQLRKRKQLEEVQQNRLLKQKQEKQHRKKKQEQSKTLLISKINLEKQLAFSRQQDQNETYNDYQSKQIKINNQSNLLGQSAIQKAINSPRLQHQIEEIKSIIQAVSKSMEKQQQITIKNQRHVDIDIDICINQKKQKKNQNLKQKELQKSPTHKKDFQNGVGFSSSTYNKNHTHINLLQPPIQQIYIVKTSKQKRKQKQYISHHQKPDEYIKIPVNSTDINIVQIITDGIHKKRRHSSHKKSKKYYQKEKILIDQNSHESSSPYESFRNCDMTAKLKRYTHQNQQQDQNSISKQQQNRERGIQLNLIKNKRKSHIKNQEIIDISELNLESQHYQKNLANSNLKIKKLQNLQNLKRFQTKLKKRQKIALQKEKNAHQKLKQLQKMQKKLLAMTIDLKNQTNQNYLIINAKTGRQKNHNNNHNKNKSCAQQKRYKQQYYKNYYNSDKKNDQYYDNSKTSRRQRSSSNNNYHNRQRNYNSNNNNKYYQQMNHLNNCRGCKFCKAIQKMKRMKVQYDVELDYNYDQRKKRKSFNHANSSKQQQDVFENIKSDNNNNEKINSQDKLNFKKDKKKN